MFLASLFIGANGVFAASWTITGNHRIMVKENHIWIESLNWKKEGPEIWLEDTNPAFFALVVNAIKDHKLSDENLLVFFDPNFRSQAHGTYKKIYQIQLH